MSRKHFCLQLNSFFRETGTRPGVSVPVFHSFSHFYIAFSEKAISKLISLSLFRYFFQASS